MGRAQGTEVAYRGRGAAGVVWRIGTTDGGCATYLQRWAPENGFERARAALLDLEGMVGARWNLHNRLVPVQPTRSFTKSTPL